MRKVILSIILVFSIFLFKNNSENLFANDEKQRVIVIVDTEKISKDNVEKLLSEGNYETVKSKNEKALDLVKEKLSRKLAT